MGRQQLHRTLNHPGRRLIIDQRPPDRKGHARRPAVHAPGLGACEAEWKLLCGTHNLLKLWRHTRRQAAPTPLAA
jgi:hypothetical protein